MIDASRWLSVWRSHVWAGLLIVVGFCGPLGCRKAEGPVEPRSITWAELRAVRLGVHLTPPGEGEREPYFRERLADGTRLRIESAGLAWLRRDAGATLLVRGPAELMLRAKSVEVSSG